MICREDNILVPVDERIDKIWHTIFLFLQTFKDDFYPQIQSSEDLAMITITTDDRKNFLEKISNDFKTNEFEEFSKLINSLNFYILLFNVAKDNDIMHRIESFLELDNHKDFYYTNISSTENYNQIINYLELDSAPLKELGKYLYNSNGFLSKIGIKENYSVDKDIFSKYREQMEGKNCPYCGEKMTKVEIDHFLPKSKYPLLSIYSNNLIPSCIECNKEKDENIELPICHPFKFNHLDYIKFIFNDYEAIAIPHVEDSMSEMELPINNMIKTTNLNRLFKRNIIEKDLRELDQLIHENAENSDILFDAAGFAFISSIKIKLFKNYVEILDSQSIIQEYAKFHL
jgi:bacteriophage lambda ninG protein